MRLYHYLRKRGLALFMALVMCLSLLPAQAMAEANPVDLTGGSQEAKWEQLDATQIRGLLGAETSTFTAGELAQKLSSTLTIDGRTVTNLGIGPEGNVADVKALASEAQYTLGGNGSVIATPNEQDQKPITYTVTYTDGVEGEEVFADQKTENLASGVATPAFNGTPTRTGYTFTGWLSGEIVYGGTAGNAFPSVTGDVTYVAQWEEAAKKTFTVTWDPANGSEPTKVEVEVGQMPAYPADPQKEGYTFKGWTPEPAAVTGDVTYTAQWEEVPADPTPDDETNSDENNIINPGGGNDEDNTLKQDNTEPQDPAAEDEKLQIASASSEFFSASEPVPVYLWAMFKKEESTASTDNSAASIEVLIDDVPFTGGGPENPLLLTPNQEVKMIVNVTFPNGSQDGELTVKLPRGMKLTNTDVKSLQEEANNRIEKDYPKFARDSSADWGGYQPNAGTVTCKFVDGTNGSGIRLHIAMDEAFWNRKKGSGPAEPMTFCTTSEGKTVFERKIVVRAKEGKENTFYIDYPTGNYSFNNQRIRYFSTDPKETFSIYKLYFRNTWDGFCYQDLTFTVGVPYVVTEEGERVDAELVEWKAVNNVSPLAHSGEIIKSSDEENHTITITIPQCYAKSDWPPGVIYPIFKWPKEVPSGLEIEHGSASGSAAYFNYDGEQKVELSVESTVNEKDVYYTNSDELVSIGEGVGGVTDWYAQNPNLAYRMCHYTLTNIGRGTSCPKKLTFEYDSDLLGIYEQSIAVPNTATELRVAYTAEDHATGAVVKGEKTIPLKNCRQYNLTTKKLGLSETSYFTKIEAWPDTGYPGGYIGDYNTTFAQMLRPLTPAEQAKGTLIFQNAIHRTVTNADPQDTRTWCYPGTNTKLPTEYYVSPQVYTKVEKHSPGVYGSISSASSLRAGEEGTISISVTAESTTYLNDPIVYLRLPKGITPEGKEGMSVTALNYKTREYEPLDADEYKPVPNPDGDPDADHTVYAIRFQEGAGAIGSYCKYEGRDSSTSLRIQCKVNVALSYSGGNLNGNETVFVTSEQHPSYAQGEVSNSRPWGKVYADAEIAKQVDFLRDDTGDGTKKLVACGGKIEVKPAIEGLLFYSGGDPMEDGGLQDVVLNEDNKSLTCEFGAWNNTENPQSAKSEAMPKFVTYIFLPRKGVQLPNMGKPHDFSLYLTRAAENTGGNTFLNVDYFTGEIPTSTAPDASWAKTVEDWGKAQQWQNAGQIGENWHGVTAVRVTVNSQSGEVIDSKKTKSFQLFLQADEDLTVGSMVQFSGMGTTFGKDGNAIPSDWNISGNPVRSSIQGVIRGKVYVDKNYNGRYDEGEELKNATVTLTQTSGVQAAPDATTGDGGIYEFRGLTSTGPYTVTVTNPDGAKYYFVGDEAAKELSFESGKLVTGENFALEEYHTVTFSLASPHASMDGKMPTVENSVVQRVKLRHNATIAGTEGVSVPKVTANTGYTFLGWQLDGSGDYLTDEQVGASTVTSDMTYFAGVSDGVRQYAIQYFYDGVQKDQKPDEYFSAKIGDTIQVTAEMKAKGLLSGYQFQEAKPADSLIISQTGTNIIKLYYVWEGAPTLTVTAKSDECFYDGNAHTVSGFENEENGVITVTGSDGKAYTITGLYSKATATNVKESVEQIQITQEKCKVLDEVGNDVTGHVTFHFVPGHLTIKPRTVTVTSKTESWPYDGKLHSATDVDDISEYDVETGVGFVGKDGFAEVKATGSITDIGYTTNTIEYKLNANTNADNYTIIKQEGILSVTPNPQTTKYQVTVEANSWKGPYDGKEHSANGFKDEIQDKGIPVTANGQTYYVTGLTSTASGKDVADSKWAKLEGTPVVKDDEGTVVTSEFFVNVIPGYLTIERAAVTLQSADVSKTYDGTPLTNEDREDKTKKLAKETGWANDEGAEYTFTGSQTGVGYSANAFSYQLKEGTDPNNYVISKSEGTLTVETRNAEDLIQLTVTARSVTATYDGNEHTASGFKDETDAGIPAKANNGVTYYVTGLTSEASGTNVADSKTAIPVKGTAIVKDAYGDVVTEQFNVNVTPGSLTISKATVTLKSKDITAEYNVDQPLTNGNYSLEVETGWASGEGATYTFTGQQAKVGRSANAFTYTLNANTNGNNYEINKSEGELIVTDRSEETKYEIKVKGDCDTVLYDGKDHTVGSSSRIDTVNINGKEFKVTIPMTPATGKDAGTYDVKVGTVTVEDSTGNNVTKQFKVIPEDGKLVINKRKVILTSGGGEKVYDGKPLENKTVHIGGDGWADNEGADYTVTGSQTTVGSKSNEFEYALKANTKEDNYIIETNKGQLTVTNRPDDARYKITVVAKNVTEKYDGNEKTADGFETLTFMVNGETYTVSGLTASGSRTDAGSTSINVSGTAVVTDAQKNPVTDQFIVSTNPGTLTVEKRKVTLTSATGTHEFDGKPFQLTENVTVGGDGYADGESFECYNFASRTLLGTTENTFDYRPADGKTNSNNYEVTPEYGTLTVTPRNTKYTINLKAKSDTFNYDGEPHAVSGLMQTEFTIDGVTYRVEGMAASATRVNAGEYPVNVVGTPVVWMGDKDVTAQFTVQPDPKPGKLTINPAPLTVKVTFKDRSYDGTKTVEVDSASIESVIYNNDDVRVLFKNDAAKTGMVADPNASTTPKKVIYDNVKKELDLAGMSSGNYVIGEVKLGDVTISKARPTVSLTVKETTYDGGPAKVDDPADPLAKPVVALPISGDQFDGEITYTYYSDQDGAIQLSGAPTDAGTYYVKASIAASDNYEAAESEIVKLVINRAPLTVTVSYRNRPYSGSDMVEATNPAISGMVEGDDVRVMFAENAVKTGKAENANAGDQSVSYNGTTADFVLIGEKKGNYVIDKVELGTVTISKATVTVTANNQSKTYDGTAFTGFTYSCPESEFVNRENWATAGVTGNVTYTGNAVGAVNVGTYTITPVVNGLSAANYQFVSANGTLTISAQPYIPPYNPTPTPTPVNPTPVTPTPTPGGTTITDENVPLAGAVGLNDTDHFAYIAGYEDDTVRPTKNITRAEVATIFFRLMTEEFRVANWATENTLKDVQTGDWYNNAVSTCANAGIITGYTDGRFQPQKAITRAEFAVIAARFLGPDADDEGVGDFSDTADHWAAAEIRKAAKAGWITGDGNKFRPNDPITRAEVMVIVNRMLDRTPDAGHMLPDMKTWIDNPEGTWYYEAVQEATNGHDYERDELNVETWTAIQTEKNWKAIEAEWAANNGASASKDDAEPVEADGESK